MTMDKDFFIGIWGPRGQVIAITLIFVTLNKQHVCIRIGTRKVIMTKNYNHMINNRTYKFQNTHFLQTIFTCSSNFNVWLWLKMMFFPALFDGKELEQKHDQISSHRHHMCRDVGTYRCIWLLTHT